MNERDLLDLASWADGRMPRSARRAFEARLAQSPELRAAAALLGRPLASREAPDWRLLAASLLAATVLGYGASLQLPAAEEESSWDFGQSLLAEFTEDT